MSDDTTPHLLDPARLAAVQKQLGKQIKADAKAQAERTRIEHEQRERNRQRLDEAMADNAGDKP